MQYDCNDFCRFCDIESDANSRERLLLQTKFSNFQNFFTKSRNLLANCCFDGADSLSANAKFVKGVAAAELSYS